MKSTRQTEKKRPYERADEEQTHSVNCETEKLRRLTGAEMRGTGKWVGGEEEKRLTATATNGSEAIRTTNARAETIPTAIA